MHLNLHELHCKSCFAFMSRVVLLKQAKSECDAKHYTWKYSIFLMYVIRTVTLHSIHGGIHSVYRLKNSLRHVSSFFR